MENKTWEFTEKLNKHSVHHTLTLSENRLTHVSEVKEATQAMKQRRDIKLSDVRAVNTYYGKSKNIPLAILLGVLAFLSLVGGIIQLVNDAAGVGVVLILLAGGFGFLAYLVYKSYKPSFVLEIDMYVSANKVINESLNYGSATLNFGKKGLLARFKPNTTKFVMDSETGNDIVNTLGEYLIH